jgi:hypothetical protein
VGGLRYIEMEYLQGKTLGDVLSDCPIRSVQAASR